MIAPGANPTTVPARANHSAGSGSTPASATHAAAAIDPEVIRRFGRRTRSAINPPIGIDTRLAQSARLTSDPASATVMPRATRNVGPKLATTITLALSTVQQTPAL